jgi:hypothetical protein
MTSYFPRWLSRSAVCSFSLTSAIDKWGAIFIGRAIASSLLLVGHLAIHATTPVLALSRADWYEQVDEIVAHAPEQCPHCQTDLPVDLPDAAPAQCHQVTEVPPIQSHVTEHRLRAVACPDCQRQVRAPLLDTVPRGAFGPHLTALIALLRGRYRLSEREVVELLADVLGGDLSLGSVAACWETPSSSQKPMILQISSRTAGLAIFRSG